jgi:hypothetical protein
VTLYLISFSILSVFCITFPVFQNTRLPHFQKLPFPSRSKSYYNLLSVPQNTRLPILILYNFSHFHRLRAVPQNTVASHFKNYLSLPDPSLGGGLEDKDVLGVERVCDLRNLKTKQNVLV